MIVTKNIAKYVEQIGISLLELSQRSGIEYSTLYASLGKGQEKRELQADELTSICAVLRINPMDFADNSLRK